MSDEKINFFSDFNLYCSASRFTHCKESKSENKHILNLVIAQPHFNNRTLIKVSYDVKKVMTSTHKNKAGSVL